MKALVTGGAGYIGSHVARLLAESSWDVLILDNFEKGHRAAARGLPVIEGDIRDAGFVREAFESARPDAVLHFAAYIEVGESVADPLRYYRNNVVGGLNVLEAAVRAGTGRFVFSSTAAVYGMTEVVPVTEEVPTAPINPYGQSKLHVEHALEAARRAHGISYAALRYFNAAGAHPDGTMGEDHRPESHLIPRILRSALEGRDVMIYGADYPTPDGTCVRDYIHILDLAEAHVLALEAMGGAVSGEVYNLGNGAGFSVREIIEKARCVTGLEIKVEEAPRRPGDAPVLVASSRKAARMLGWRPKHADIHTIMATAWRWHSLNPGGYREVEKS